MSNEPKAPLTTTTSIWPAASIVGLAVLMLVTFLIIDVVANQGVVKETTTIPAVVGGLARVAHPSATLTYCNQGEEVPSNITDAFQIPVGTATAPGANTPNSGAGDFDCYQPFVTSHASSGAIESFFDAQLGARGWSLFSRGAASNGDPESLFQKAGSDGFYWIVGVTVTKSTSSSVDWTFRIYQNSETI